MKKLFDNFFLMKDIFDLTMKQTYSDDVLQFCVSIKDY